MIPIRFHMISVRFLMISMRFFLISVGFCEVYSYAQIKMQSTPEIVEEGVQLAKGHGQSPGASVSTDPLILNLVLEVGKSEAFLGGLLRVDDRPGDLVVRDGTCRVAQHGDTRQLK